MASTYLLTSSLFVRRPRAEVFDFFADARNLEFITPPWLKFNVLTPTPIAMRVGALIDYKLKVRGFPMRWQSEITAWEPPHRFIDEQRRGPYRLWIHEHTFVEQDGGTLVSDRVEYAVPGGAIVRRLFVAPDLEKIFAFRRERLAEHFGGVQ